MALEFGIGSTGFETGRPALKRATGFETGQVANRAVTYILDMYCTCIFAFYHFSCTRQCACVLFVRHVLISTLPADSVCECWHHFTFISRKLPTNSNNNYIVCCASLVRICQLFAYYFVVLNYAFPYIIELLSTCMKEIHHAVTLYNFLTIQTVEWTQIRKLCINKLHCAIITFMKGKD